MTKWELLRVDENHMPICDEEIFERSKRDLHDRLYSVFTSVSTGVFLSRIWSSRQKRLQTEFLEQLQKLLRDVEKWEYHSKIDIDLFDF